MGLFVLVPPPTLFDQGNLKRSPREIVANMVISLAIQPFALAALFLFISSISCTAKRHIRSRNQQRTQQMADNGSGSSRSALWHWLKREALATGRRWSDMHETPWPQTRWWY